MNYRGHRAVLVCTVIVIALALGTTALLPTPRLRAQDMPPTPTPIPRPQPVTTIDGEGKATLELYFQKIVEGETGLLHITGQNVTGARALFANKFSDFFPIPDDGFYGLLAVSMEQHPRTYDLAVVVQFADSSTVTMATTVDITLGNFIRQDFVVPPDRAYLIDPQIERSEFARLDSVFSTVTAQKLWGATGFEMPIAAELTSPFGAYRILNQTVQTRHTGWDLKAAVGTPVMATASGKVAFAGLIDIRGNYVVIDHGYGIFSGYAHLSQIHVTRGQSVAQGQIIGVSGNTGRSNGPHLHWEMAVNGEWVDTVQFMTLWLP